MKLFLPVIFVLVALPSIAQDVTKWRGYFNETNYRRNPNELYSIAAKF
jgi:hypothetical protein